MELSDHFKENGFKMRGERRSEYKEICSESEDITKSISCNVCARICYDNIDMDLLKTKRCKGNSKTYRE